MNGPATDQTTTPATRRLLDAMSPRAGVAVAFHLPSVREVADDDQIRGMYFLDESVDLDSIEAIAMAPGGASMLLKDGTVRLPPACPRSQESGPSLLDSHAEELRHLEPLGRLCIGVGRIAGLPPVALALDFENGFARGAAVLRSEPRGGGLDLLSAIGVGILSTTTLSDGRVRVELENRLAAHLDAARLSQYRRTGNCNRFFLSHGEADGDLERGLVEAARARIAAGRERLATATIEVATRALDESLALHQRPPGATETKPYGDLVPLGFLGAALIAVRDAGGGEADAAAKTLTRLRTHVDSHRRHGLWGYSRGCIPTSTDTALVALAGLDPDFDALESLRGDSGGFIPQAVTTEGGGDAMRRTPATAHWEEEDIPTTALVEAMRLDAGLDPIIDARWLLQRFRKWGGLYFTPPTMGLWALARFASRLPERPAAASTEEEPDIAWDGELRSVLIRMVHAARRVRESGSDLDPVLRESLGILALAELGAADRFALSGQVRVLAAWERDEGVETPFHSTLIRRPARDFGELMSMQADPSTAFLYDTAHAVTLYEDPHRLVVTALACLALHVDASEIRSAEEGRRIDPRFGESLPAQAFLHVEPYAAPLRFLGADATDPFVVPRDHIPLGDAMADTIERLGPDLVSERARGRIVDAVERTDPSHVKGSTFGLEFRLDPEDDTVDFLWCLNRGNRNLTALLSNPDPHSRFRHLARLWNMPAGSTRPPIAHIDSIWFEHDLDHEDDGVPPAFFFGPSSLETANDVVYGPPAVARNIRRVTEALELDVATHEGLTATADRVERLGTDAAIFQTGLMFSRGSNPVRLCFKPVEDRERVIEVLQGVGLGDRLDSIAGILGRIPGGRIAPCIDLTPDGVRPRVGFECYPDSQAASSRSFARSVIDGFRDSGRVDAAKAEAFLGIEGWAELDRRGGVQRTINHVKVLLEADDQVTVKGYLALNRRPTPAFQALDPEPAGP